MATLLCAFHSFIFQIFLKGRYDPVLQMSIFCCGIWWQLQDVYVVGDVEVMWPSHGHAEMINQIWRTTGEKCANSVRVKSLLGWKKKAAERHWSYFRNKKCWKLLGWWTDWSFWIFLWKSGAKLRWLHWSHMICRVCQQNAYHFFKSYDFVCVCPDNGQLSNGDNGQLPGDNGQL